jgi:hypothetical protein
VYLRALAVATAVVACSRAAPLAAPQEPLSNKPAPPPTAPPSPPSGWIPVSSDPIREECYGFNLQDFRAANVDYEVKLGICPEGDMIVAQLVLTRGTERLKQTIETWKGSDPTEPPLQIAAVLIGPEADAVVVVREPYDAWTVATVWTFDGTAWKQVGSASAQHIWVHSISHAQRNTYARAETCYETDPHACMDRTKLEEWRWDGSKLVTKPCNGC